MSLSGCCVQLLSAIILNCSANWRAFEDSVRLLHGSESSTLQQTGLMLLESLLRGRRIALEENQIKISSEVVHVALSLLHSATVSGPCRSLAFQAYGHLLGSDWLGCSDEKTNECLEHHLRIILSHCSGPAKPAAIRTAAVKAVGDICSNCFLVENKSEGVSLLSKEHLEREKHLRLMGNDVCKIMLQSLENSNAAVRSMVCFALSVLHLQHLNPEKTSCMHLPLPYQAIFTIGNIAQVIASCNYQNVLDPMILQEVSLRVYECLDDENDKVCLSLQS